MAPDADLTSERSRAQAKKKKIEMGTAHDAKSKIRVKTLLYERQHHFYFRVPARRPLQRH